MMKIFGEGDLIALSLHPLNGREDGQNSTNHGGFSRVLEMLISKIGRVRLLDLIVQNE